VSLPFVSVCAEVKEQHIDSITSSSVKRETASIRNLPFGFENDK